MYPGDRRDLQNFINRFFSWAVTHQVEEALTYETPVLMTTKKSRAELKRVRTINRGQITLRLEC